MKNSDEFPKDFLWGAASASYQVEGAAAEDGRGVSIWDTFSKTPGKVCCGMTGDVACDSYHLYADDIRLLRKLGVDAYRFSIAWPRIQPSGRGAANRKGLEYYDRLTDGLLREGIQPWATLYHWDLPQTLEDEGGWPERETALRFAEFADTCFRSLGDRVSGWMTLNEPWCSSILGYLYGQHAPGKKDLRSAYRAVHHLLLAHGLAMEAYRGLGLAAPIGIVVNPSTPRPATRRPEDILAADRAADQRTALWFDPLSGRGYPERHLSAMGVAMPILNGDMKKISIPGDFFGINYYNEECVEFDPDSSEGFDSVPTWQEKTSMDWDVVPNGLYRLLMKIQDRWAPKALYVMENGSAWEDRVEADGRIRDEKRITYLRSHLKACRNAIEDGASLKGYFAWSLLDNFEWAHGYSQRFGLVHVDFATGARRPKDSFYYYRDVVAGQGL